ncbi:unnamed protein product [Spodoptera littoralis]|uniref:Uncharacterized protein n=1 Tax=Spodoptera littoralis TaxID=7109 RepID=A0A9P0N6Q0_SPOLI|nr:unnamed protein product [Spodoptera littoralis]CAH1643505.1 unnamed protein product [Spodoptera littoralis]
MNIKWFINLAVLFVASDNLVQSFNISVYDICPLYKKGASLNIHDVVGRWMTVYTQPRAIDCFKFQVRATTDLEREQYVIKYGEFDGRVDWNLCLLQVETIAGKHFLMGNGSESGLLENIIIMENKNGDYMLQNQSADQWMLFGRRGSEVLMIRDCYGETAAAFARAPYWPSTTELSAIFHRSGIAAQTRGRLLCEPHEGPRRQPHYVASYSHNTNRNY